MQSQLKVLIARVSVFHNGHAELLSKALKTSDNVLLLIGSAGLARNIKNPFTFEERRDVVMAWARGQLGLICAKRLIIRPLYDQPYNDQKWITQVQEEVVETLKGLSLTDVKPVLTGADRDSSSWYLKAFGDFFQLDLHTASDAGFDLSATMLRLDYFAGGYKFETRCPDVTSNFLDHFRTGEHYKNLVAEYEFVKKYKESWSKAPYAPTFVTTDCCVVQSGHVLVIVRDAFPGAGLWALPGGFLEQDEKLVDGAVRELIEETSIGLSKAQLYGSIVDKEIFDHPDRSLRGRTITTCFLFKLDDTKPLPKIKAQAGEVRKLMWVPLSQAYFSRDKWFEDHHAMFSTMISRIKN